MRKQIFKILLYSILVLSLSGVASSCQKDDDGTSIPNPGKEKNVTIHFGLLPSSKPANTRALTAGDDIRVDDITVLAFIEETPGGNFLYEYCPDIRDLNLSGGAGSFSATLRVTDKKQKFVIIANAAQSVSDANLYGGSTFDGVLSSIEYGCSVKWPANNDASGFKAFPMCAIINDIVVDESFSTIGSTSNPHFLYRMVARIDITQSANMQTSDFRLVNAYVYRSMTKGLVAYNPSAAYWHNCTSAHAQKAFVTPDSYQTSTPKESYVNYEYMADTSDPDHVNHNIVNSIFTFEAKGVMDYSKATAIVIGGYKTGDPLKPVYYRLDVRTQPHGSPLEAGYVTADILRNHSYNIIINSVSGNGAETPTDAYDRVTPYIIDADVEVWNPATVVGIFDRQYNLYVSESKVNVGKIATFAQIEIKTDHPDGISLALNYVDGAGWLTYQKYGADIYQFDIAENNDGAQRAANLVVSAGNMRYTIKFQQDSF